MNMTDLNVTTAPKTATFQMRINPEIKAELERIYARSGLTMTEAINVFLQRTLTDEEMPVELSPRYRDRLHSAMLRLLTEDLDRRVEANRDGRNLIPEEDVLRELGVAE